jgi:hypothetical protein
LVTRPDTTEPCSIEASRSCHAFKTLGLVARQARRAVTVLDRFDRDGDEIAGFYFDFASVVLEFLDRNERFGLQARVDDDDIEIDADDFSGDELALAHFLPRERLLEQSGKIFGCGGRGGGLSCGCHTGLVSFRKRLSAASRENPVSRARRVGR